MSYHRDEKVNEAIVRLLDELCQYERDTSYGSTLVLILPIQDGKVLRAMDGKPILPSTPLEHFVKQEYRRLRNSESVASDSKRMSEK